MKLFLWQTVVMSTLLALPGGANPTSGDIALTASKQQPHKLHSDPGSSSIVERIDVERGKQRTSPWRMTSAGDAQQSDLSDSGKAEIIADQLFLNKITGIQPGSDYLVLEDFIPGRPDSKALPREALEKLEVDFKQGNYISIRDLLKRLGCQPDNVLNRQKLRKLVQDTDRRSELRLQNVVTSRSEDLGLILQLCPITEVLEGSDLYQMILHKEFDEEHRPGDVVEKKYTQMELSLENPAWNYVKEMGARLFDIEESGIKHLEMYRRAIISDRNRFSKVNAFMGVTLTSDLRNERWNEWIQDVDSLHGFSKPELTTTLTQPRIPLHLTDRQTAQSIASIIRDIQEMAGVGREKKSIYKHVYEDIVGPKMQGEAKEWLRMHPYWEKALPFIDKWYEDNPKSVKVIKPNLQPPEAEQKRGEANTAWETIRNNMGNLP